MDTAVIEFDTLTDPVRASAKDHDLRFAGADRILIPGVVGRIIIRAVRRSAYMYALPGLFHTQFNPAGADGIFGNVKDLT